MANWRVSDEDGREASARNFGRLALFLIPLALGLGAVAWLSFSIGAHRFGKALSQDERAAMYVCAAQRQTSPIKFDTSKQTYCAGVTRADLDGDVLRLYAKNDCNGGPLTGMSWHWEAISPDGTILHEGDANWCPIPRLKGDSAECVFVNPYNSDITYFTIDDRISTVRVWTVPYSGK